MITCFSTIPKSFVLAALLLLLFLPVRSRALPRYHPEETTWRTMNVWRQAQGLPQNSVKTILQTRDGYMWIGTKGGLARFDGVRFTTFDDRNKNQLRENEVWALVEGDDASLWIGTFGGGLSRLKDGQFTIYTTKEGLVNDFVVELCKDLDGSIWIATDQGLSHFKDGEFTNYTVKDGLTHNTIRALYLDRDGSLLIGTNKGGFHRFKDGKISTLTIEGLNSSMTVESIHRDREQSLWMVTSEGVFRLKEGQVSHYTTNEGLSSNWILQVQEDAQGNIWVATEKGLDKYHRIEDSFFKVQSTDGLYSIYSDREGSLWVGYMRDGLACFRQGLFTSYTAKDGLTDETAITVFQDRKGNIWIGTVKGLILFRDGRFTPYTDKGALFDSRVSAIVEDKGGNLLVGTDRGLFHLTYEKACAGGHCMPTSTPLIHELFSKTRITSIHHDQEGRFWIGTSFEGIIRYQDGQFTSYTTNEGLSNNAIRGLSQSQDGGLWIATKGGGLNHFKDGKFTVYAVKDGLVSDNLQALYTDKEKALWIATRQGISRLKDGKFTTITVNDGLFANYVYSFVEDDKGNLWMGCGMGIFRVNKQQLDDFADGKIKSFVSVAYGLEHGLSSTVLVVANNTPSYKTSDGRVWFGSQKGVSVVNPENLSVNTLTPPVHIEEISVDDRSFDLHQLAEAAPGRGDLVFRYTGLSFFAPEKVRFKYRLEGYDRDWVEAGDRRAAFYSNIAPGTYTFRVIAANSDGIWNEEGAAFTIYLAPHFYQTYWFYGICLGVLGLLVIGVHRVRIRQLRAHEQELGQLVEQRTGELQEQRTFLRKVIDLNPSYIFAKNRQGQFTLANRTIAEAYGTTVDNLIGKTNADFSPHKEQAEEFRQEDLQVLDSKTEMFIPEKEFTSIDGNSRWMQVIKIPLLSADGEAQQLLAVATDITLQKQAAIAMQRAKETAEDANRAKSEFLANMSHEIRTPMNGIIGMTELTLDTELAPEQREYLTMVKDSADALLSVINDILDFSKIEAGKLDLDPVNFHLRDSLDDAIKALALRAHQKGLELACHVLPDVPDDLIGDPGRLRQIIINLIGNAIKFTSDGEIVVRVAVHSQDLEDTLLHFTVTDTGMGIPLDKQQVIFEAFSQADGSTTRRYGGTGLGLTISSQLVEIMGGQMRVESIPETGSSFHFTARFGLQKEGLDIDQKKPEINWRHLPVLIVDDNATNCRILKEVLTNWQMNPTVAESGQQALDALQQAKETGVAFRLVLLDAQMPEMDGFTLAEKLKGDPRLAGATIMMLSSAGQRGDALRCRELGIAAYLTKPVKQSELFSAILTLLGASSAQQSGAPVFTGHWLGENREGYHILLAEDNRVNQRLAGRLLEKAGHRVVIASNGLKAVAAFEKEAFDLILMDVQMPEMNGYEATASIREKEKVSGGHIPIIAMTAHAMKGDRERCLEAGMDGYVAKPIKIEELFEAIALCTGIQTGEGESIPGDSTTEGVFDLEEMLSRTGGDEELLRELVDLFLEEYAGLLLEIEEAIAHSNSQGLEFAAHTLRGSVGNLGAKSAYNAAKNLEMIGREGNLSGATEAYAVLRIELERLQPALAMLSREVMSQIP